MITRETVGDEVLNTTNPNILCELPTGFGKSKIAIDLMQKYAEGKAISRTELKITLEEIIQHAAGVLKYSGKLYMIHKSERLAEVLTTMSNNNLEPKKITFIYFFKIFSCIFSNKWYNCIVRK